MLEIIRRGPGLCYLSLFGCLSIPVRKFEMSLASRGVRCDRGFTLVELLVVIAIIGDLDRAAACRRCRSARESARRSQCVNNLKQVRPGVGQLRIGPQVSCLPGYVSQFMPSRHRHRSRLGLGRAVARPRWRKATSPGRFSSMYRSRTRPKHVAITTPLPVYLCPSDIREPIWAADAALRAAV